MKTINEDPYEFFQQGGWTFLGGSAGGEEVSYYVELWSSNSSLNAMSIRATQTTILDRNLSSKRMLKR